MKGRINKISEGPGQRRYEKKGRDNREQIIGNKVQRTENK